MNFEKTMIIEWYKCRGGVWCELFKLDLTHKYLDTNDCVYVIWSGMTTRNILKVGSGNIKNEFAKQKKELAIMAFQHHGVYVAWAEVPSGRKNGIEHYLYEKLSPKLPSSAPKGLKTKVNLPWDVVLEEYDDE